MRSTALGLCLVGAFFARGVAADQGSSASSANGPSRSVVDGVYTELQRKSGLNTYLKHCSSCHGERLHGGESSPALSGVDFQKRWDGRTLDDLMQKVAVMPPNDPGQLTAEEGANVIAVILAANGFPTGSEELTGAAQQLQQIKIEPRRNR
jgi:mono/diheme cytochrome c family protein